ncbi:MAG: urea transporter [Anaerolineaceae bacterium]|nr:MAG: urea transporter [Anaerolineaceae bacterium]
MTEIQKHPVFKLVESLFRGAGNVVFQDNALSGLLIIIGIGLSSWTAAVDFLIGAAIATIAALWFRADRHAIDHGMFAFSGGYVGLLMGVLLANELPFLTSEWLLLLVLGSVLAVPLTAGLGFAFGKLNISATALPILLLLWAIMAGVLYTNLPQNSVAPQVLPAGQTAAYTWETFVFGILNGFGQIFVQVNPVTGALILLGILINSRIAGLMAILGGATAVLVASVLGYDEPVVQNGVVAFNSILTAIGLGGFFLMFDGRSVVYALIGSLLALWVFLVMAVLLNPLGLPALSIGFVLVVAIMMLGAQTYGFVKVVPLEEIGRPEDLLSAARK